MCSISASFSRNKIIELCELNSYRGQHSHSISYYDTKNKKMVSVERKLGPIDYNDINQVYGDYIIVHQQAPTTENASIEFIHPAKSGKLLLWHNGILKPETIKKLQKEVNSNSTWDSYLLADYLVFNTRPDNIDGSFACLMEESGELYLFRNEIAPMFIDNDLNISSTKFEGGKAIEPNKMFVFSFEDNKLLKTSVTFRTVNNPYAI